MQGDRIMEQAILELIESGDLRRHHKRMINYYIEKRNFFINLLDYYLKDKVEYNVPEGGLAFWIKPIKDLSLYKVKEMANIKLVSFYTPDRFSFSEPILGMRLGYALYQKKT